MGACPRCGVDLDDAAPVENADSADERETERKQRRRRTRVLVAAGTVTAVIAAGAVFVVSHRDTSATRAASATPSWSDIVTEPRGPATRPRGPVAPAPTGIVAVTLPY